MKLHPQVLSKLATASVMSMFLLHAHSQSPAAGAAPATPQAAGPASTATQHRQKNDGTPKADLFLGYSHFRAVPTYADGNRMVALNGGEASLAFNFTPHFALVADFAGYADGQLRLTGTSVNEPRDVNSSGTAFTYMAGPRFSFYRGARVSPFMQVLAGAVHASPVVVSNCSGAPECTALPAQNAFAMTAGGGLDLRLTHHVSLRLVQAEYMMTRFSDVATGAGGSQNDMRLSSGLVFSFGGAHHREMAKLPPTVSCSVDGRTIYAGSGERLGVHAVANDPDNEALSYAWSASGGAIDGSGPDAQWNSTGTAAGAYKVHVTVKDTDGATADCSTEVHVEAQQIRQPTMSCSADRAAVTSGSSVQITAAVIDPGGDPLTFSWSSTAGRVTGSGASVSLDTSSVPAGSYVVTGHVDDVRGGAADCTVRITVQEKTPAVLEAQLALRSIYFPTAEPSEEHPDTGLVASQQAALAALAADFQTYLQAHPNAVLTLEGHADPRGSAEYNQRLSERRVEVTKAFLVAHGVPAGAIETKAFGLQQGLSQAEVEESVRQNPDLTPEQRTRLLENSTTIVLASNRRVDLRLDRTGQQSARVYPFHEPDSPTLLRQRGTRGASRKHHPAK